MVQMEDKVDSVIINEKQTYPKYHLAHNKNMELRTSLERGKYCTKEHRTKMPMDCIIARLES